MDFGVKLVRISVSMAGYTRPSEVYCHDKYDVVLVGGQDSLGTLLAKAARTRK